MQVEPNFDHEDELAADDSGKSSQTKQKCAVAVLLVVLLIAVLCQPDDEESHVETSAMVSLKADGAADGTRGPNAATADLSQFVRTRQLSRASLDEVVASPAFSAERIAAPRVQPSRLTVQAVYGSDRQQSAIVGNSIVRSGQPLPDGRKVLSVTPEGVKLGQ
jgi:hypothetical protein